MDGLGALLGPERIASIMAVAVVAVAVSVGWSGQRRVAATPASSAPASETNPVESLTPPPAESASAAALIEMIDEVLELGTDLEQARSQPDAGRVGVILRRMNASIIFREGALATLATEPSRAGLATRIRTATESILDASRSILRAGTANTEAYLEGASEVISLLNGLPALRGELVATIGRSPTPDVSTPDPRGTGEPSAPIGQASPGP